MNTTSRWGGTRRRLGFICSRWALLVLFLIASPTLSRAQLGGIENPGFESATFVPVQGFYPSSVDPVAAVPGWQVYWGTNLAPFVLHDTMFLDSAGVSVLDTNCAAYGGWACMSPAFEGKVTLLLQGGTDVRYGPPSVLSVAVAQTTLIPATATTLLFDAALMYANGPDVAFDITIGGEQVPFYLVHKNSNDVSFPNPAQYGLDVSRFAGQSAEIRFTSRPNPPPALPINNNYLDHIYFSSIPMQPQLSYVTNNATITITGFTGPAGSVIVPEIINGLPVTSIGAEAFYQCLSLTNITLPNNLLEIATGAFQNCGHLTGIVIPNQVRNIPDSAFSGCASLSTVTIPAGVTNIGSQAFMGCTSLSGITIPSSVVSIGPDAFFKCLNLLAVYFKGNAPTIGLYAFPSSSNCVLYYLPGTTGWGTLSGYSTALWVLPNPVILNTGPSFGVQNNRFGFTISWATNILVAVDACSDFLNGSWHPLVTNELTGGTSYFSDPNWTNFTSRFYRVRSP